MPQASEQPALTLATPLEEVSAIPEKAAKALATLGLTNVGKLIAHIPLRHERQEAEATADALVAGQVVSVRGEIASSKVVRFGKPRVEAVLMDHTGRVDLVWFNMLFVQDKVRPGARVRVQGQAKTRGRHMQIINPRVEVLREHEPPAREARLRPVYPAGEGVPSTLIEKTITSVLPEALVLLEDHLPESFRRERALPTLAEAYRMQHAPANEEEVPTSRRRLAYDELLLLQLGVHLKRAHLRETLRAPALKHGEALDQHIRARFPFTLTPGQDAVLAEIAADLSRSTPTNRLIQGDVGSGKTLVALYAMLMSVATGHQAALMAPTEILAEQHFASIRRVLAGSKVRVELLTGATPKPEREALLPAVADGRVDLLIGTHALLTQSVEFASLAVSVIDEQHRFGVHQRAVLREKSSDAATTPHVLVMTATPIPRTLAITLFGDLDISTITGLPPGRQPILTRVSPSTERHIVYGDVARRIALGQQAYVVVPAIHAGSEADAQADIVFEPGEDAGETVKPALKNIKEVHEELTATFLPKARIGVLHGQLPRPAREAVMERFRAGQLDVLLATTVIEVGVDVPNATAMVVEQADRFGLAQLHQLRGRVGRGSAASACHLIADPLTPEGQQRLIVMEQTTDGFALAEKDLEIRGPGQMFGHKQSGLPPFKVADLSRDRELLAMARRDAAEWISRSPALKRREERVLLRRLLKAYGKHLGLADVG